MRFNLEFLDGQNIRLEKMQRCHAEGLRAVIEDGKLWQLFVTRIPHPDAMENFFVEAENLAAKGEGLAFVTVDKASGELVGSTRFLNTQWQHRRTEIGFTFIGSRWQRSHVNTEAKFLMLRYAFEVLKMQRVEFLTDYLNLRSREAILRLGAKQEGILRKHMLMPDGRQRDSVLFSVLDSEWPGVQQHLGSKMKIKQYE